MSLRTEHERRASLKYLVLQQVVKVADFGVARVQTQSGVMTAETGTYRWMAPEVWIFLEFNVSS